MKNGKIPENILKRSVLKQISYRRNEVQKGAGVGADCAFFACNDEQSEILVISTQTVTLPAPAAVKYAILAAVNNIAAGYGEPAGIMLALTLPPATPEGQLKEIMKTADDLCQDLNIQIMGGHTEISDAVIRPVITVTATGRQYPAAVQHRKEKHHMAGCDIIMSKWIGLEGSVLLVNEKEKEIAGRYPSRMINRIKEFERYLCVVPEAATAVRSGVCAMHDVRGGGIFGALWELSQSTGTGLKVDLKKIPVKQETIEICEFLHVNPYELLSGGALLMCARDGEALRQKLQESGIDAAIIGKLTNNNDKIVYNDGEIRYLDPPRGDQIYMV